MYDLQTLKYPGCETNLFHLLTTEEKINYLNLLKSYIIYAKFSPRPGLHGMHSLKQHIFRHVIVV